MVYIKRLQRFSFPALAYRYKNCYRLTPTILCICSEATEYLYVKVSTIRDKKYLSCNTEIHDLEQLNIARTETKTYIDDRHRTRRRRRKGYISNDKCDIKIYA